MQKKILEVSKIKYLTKLVSGKLNQKNGIKKYLGVKEIFLSQKNGVERYSLERIFLIEKNNEKIGV